MTSPPTPLPPTPPSFTVLRLQFGSGGEADRRHGGGAAAAAEGGQGLPGSAGGVAHRAGEGHRLQDPLALHRERQMHDSAQAVPARVCPVWVLKTHRFLKSV